MLGPCIGKNLLTTLETDYIQKRGGYLGLFSFEYNLFPKLFNRFLLLHGPVQTYFLATLQKCYLLTVGLQSAQMSYSYFLKKALF